MSVCAVCVCVCVFVCLCLLLSVVIGVTERSTGTSLNFQYFVDKHWKGATASLRPSPSSPKNELFLNRDKEIGYHLCSFVISPLALVLGVRDLGKSERRRRGESDVVSIGF